MKKFLEPTVELLSFQAQEATLAEFNELDTRYGVASTSWWDEE